MKKLIFILALLPMLAGAQKTLDSLLGCYVGIYKHYEQPDTTWTSIYSDTLIVFKVDSMLYQNNDTSYYNVSIGWVLKNATTTYNHYYTICTYEFGFRECPWSLDTMINYCYDEHKDEIIFKEDSIFYVGKYQYGQFANEETVNFKGKKYSSQIPDSLLHINVKEINNANFVKIYPNPTKQYINIEVCKTEETKLELTNLSGKLIFSAKFNSNIYKIDMQNYNKGVYIVKFTTKNNSFTTKIVYL